EDYVGGWDTTAKIISKDFNLLATGTYLFRNGLNVFGKVGGARVEQIAQWNGVTNNVPFSEQTLVQYKPMVATGIGYQYRTYDLFFQYSHIFGTNADNFGDLFDSNGNMSEVASVDTFNVGAAVHFRI